MRAAVIDVGSNTIKLKIFDCTKTPIEEVFSAVKNTKLISYINDGILNETGIALLSSHILELKVSASSYGYDTFSCFATASLRRAKNLDEAKKAVFDFCGVAIDLVSGDDEAYLSFSGVKNTMEGFPTDALLFDMGGGSTEVVECRKQEKKFSKSMNFGSLSMHLDYPDNDFEAIKGKAAEYIKSISDKPLKSENAILVGGAALAINTLYLHFFPDSKPLFMTFEGMNELYNRLKAYDEYTIKLLEEKTPHRVTTVIPGLASYIGMFEACEIKNITVSTSGIREGYVTEIVMKNRSMHK